MKKLWGLGESRQPAPVDVNKLDRADLTDLSLVEMVDIVYWPSDEYWVSTTEFNEIATNVRNTVHSLAVPVKTTLCFPQVIQFQQTFHCHHFNHFLVIIDINVTFCNSPVTSFLSNKTTMNVFEAWILKNEFLENSQMLDDAKIYESKF